jgi:Mg-chelatase subunit ChlD
LDPAQGNGPGEGQPEVYDQVDKTNPGDGADINEDENDEMGGAGADPNMDMQGESSSEEGGDAQAQQGKVDPKQAKKAKDLADAIQKQKDFLDGKIKKKSISKSDANKVNAAAESNMTLESVGGDLPNDTSNRHSGNRTNCTVVKGINNNLIESGLLGNQAQNPEDYKNCIAKYGYTDYIAEGIVLGTLLGKRLKTRDEDRTLKTTRMETGRIDRRLVAELGFGNDHVFTQTIHNTVTPSLIHISVDASGSMSGSKWDAAMKTSVAIAKAASMISSMDVVISARGTMGNYGNQTPLMWVVYDSRKDKFEQFRHKAYAVCCGGSTPEGLCFQAVMKEVIASANGKEMYFINISDGEPGYSDNNIQYGGDYANRHTKAQVDKMRANGIKVLSYFVSDSDYGMDRSRVRFQEMYGKNAEIIDINNLTQLSTSLNKLFVRNV